MLSVLAKQTLAKQTRLALLSLNQGAPVQTSFSLSRPRVQSGLPTGLRAFSLKEKRKNSLRSRLLATRSGETILEGVPETEAEELAQIEQQVLQQAKAHQTAEKIADKKSSGRKVPRIPAKRPEQAREKELKSEQFMESSSKINHNYKRLITDSLNSAQFLNSSLSLGQLEKVLELVRANLFDAALRKAMP
jgi:hypothetical protein